MTGARVNTDGYLEVERIINGETYFVVQLCIRKDSYCGPACPAFSYTNDSIFLRCVTQDIIFEQINEQEIIWNYQNS